MVKKSGDYIEALLKYYPELAKSELKQIIDYGLIVYAWVNKCRADVTLIKRGDNPILIHTGDLGYDTFKHYLRWVTKFRMKERVMWRLLRKKWDGYYYIGINDELHKELLKQKFKKKKTFRNVYLTKIKLELYHNKLVTHIWRVPFLAECGWKFFVEKLTSEAEYIGENLYGKYHKCFYGRNNNGLPSADNAEHIAD